MKKYYLPLLLIVSLLLAMLSGCGDRSSPAQSEEQNSPEVTTAQTDAPAEPTEDVSSSETSSAVEPEASARHVSYPLTTEAVTLSYWNLYMNNLAGFLDDYNDHILNDAVAAATGIRLEWHDVSMQAAAENFNLILASGDFLDFMPVTKYYTGGVGKALDDSVILDLTEYMEEWAPDYLAAMNAGNTKKDLTDDNGRVLQFATIQDQYLPVSGLTIRQDWLDELDLKVPETVDELYDVLVAVKNEHPECARPLYLDKEGKMNEIYGAFDTMALSMEIGMMAGEGIHTAIYQRDGVAASGLRDDGYREYLEFFHKLYAAGLTDHDFYNAADSGTSQNANRSAGDQFIWYGNSDDFSVIEDSSEDADINIQAIAPIVKNKGDTYKFGEYHTYLGMQYASVMSTCEEPELAVAFLNYFYSKEGSILGNYGIEGLSFEYDDNGDPQFTDTVLANPDGMPTNVAMMYYSFSSIPTLSFRDRSFSAYLDKEIEAMEMWKETSTGEYIMPTMNFTTEESTEYAGIASDLYTYACEASLKFITGAAELNDANWDDFQNHLTDMDLDRCVALYQAALDRYLAR